MDSAPRQSRVTKALDSITRKTKRKLRRLSEDLFTRNQRSNTSGASILRPEAMDNTANDYLEQQLLTPEVTTNKKHRRRTMCPKLLQETTTAYRQEESLQQTTKAYRHEEIHSSTGYGLKIDAVGGADSGFSSGLSSDNSSSSECLSHMYHPCDDTLTELVGPEAHRRYTEMPAIARIQTIKKRVPKQRHSIGYCSLGDRRHEYFDSPRNVAKKGNVWYSNAAEVNYHEDSMEQYLDRQENVSKQLFQDGLLSPHSHSCPASASKRHRRSVTPILELIETDQESGLKHTMYQAYKGQLDLGIYVNHGLVTVHVKEARHLVSPAMTCNPFVKVAIAADDQQPKNHLRRKKRVECRSSVMFSSTNPLFDEKFSFELSKGSVEKRLLVSIWDRDSECHKSSHFLGGMAFSVRSLLQKTEPTEGWYYLLSEANSDKKHLKAVPHDMKVLSEEMSFPSEQIQFISKKVYLRRTNRSYGFSMHGASPVIVSKVIAGSAAEAAGIQVGDQIVKVCGEKVDHFTAELVGQMIVSQEGYITMEVYRKEVRRL